MKSVKLSLQCNVFFGGEVPRQSPTPNQICYLTLMKEPSLSSWKALWYGYQIFQTNMPGESKKKKKNYKKI